MRINILIFSFLASFNLLASNEIKPSRATLELDLGPEMEVEMLKLDDETWKLVSTVDYGAIFQRNEEEIFKLQDNQIEPISYNFKQRSFFKRENNNANFNWEEGEVNYSLGKNKGKLAFTGNVLGPSSASLQLRLDFREFGEGNIPTEISYQVYWKGTIKKRTYSIGKDKETIETLSGIYEAYKVTRQFEKGSKRLQIFWLAPELDYSVIKIVDKNDRESEIKLKTFEEMS